MVKEFQQLRKQMTQRLLEQQQQQKEIEALVTKQAREKEEWFLDIIDLIEKLSRKEAVLGKVPQVEIPSKNDSQEIYNSIQSDLMLLLSKYGVQPIVGYGRFKEEEEGNEKGVTEASSTQRRFTYQGKILSKI